MSRRGTPWLGLALCLAAFVAEAAPVSSLRPVGREAAAPPRLSTSGAVSRIEPALDLHPPAGVVTRISAQAAAASLRPSLRPAGIVQQAMAKKRKLRRGAICDDIDIQGDEVGIVQGAKSGCGIANAVRVRSVAGVGLTQQSVMDCTTAKALKRWITRSAKPALNGQGGGLARLRVAAHYACRTRNNKTGAKISEHGKGRAIDISGFQLKDGRMITVLEGWNARGTSAALRQMHKGACGPFGTVLGPNADRYHRDHFHFDTARYRSGAYCR